MNMPVKVKIVEVGPRDGLQNEPGQISLAIKQDLIHLLENAGVRYIEVGSFVSPKWVPQMADTPDLFAHLHPREGVTYAALTPNMKGLEAALDSGVREVAVFGAASESFSHKNINCSIAESLARFRPVVNEALSAGVRVRGYVSCVVECPYEGAIKPEASLAVSEKLLEMGCYEISLGDTIGKGTAASVEKMLAVHLKDINVDKLAVHMHDTYGQALANILISLQMGIATVDSSVAGLGGCPYAAGASGNVATEDVVYMLNGMGIETGINLDKLVDAGLFISEALGKESNSKVALARSPKACGL